MTKKRHNTIFGKANKGRDIMLEESFTMALRQDDWKYIAPQSKPTPDWLRNKNIPTGLSDQAQLYNLKNDKKEQNNSALQQPEKLKEMQSVLNEILKSATRPK